MSRKHRAKPSYNRRRLHSQKPVRESFLIFCEGETEVLKTIPLLGTALANARRGHTSFQHDMPDAHKQTSTLVYMLVEAIMAHT